MNSGVMFWQLNDVWAAPTWSAVDVKLRPKMLYYAVKNLYEPVVGSAYWNTTHVVLYVVNQLDRSVKFDFDLFLYNASSPQSLDEWIVDGVVDPTSSTEVFSISKTNIVQRCPVLERCFVGVEFSVQSESIRTVDIARPGFDWIGLVLRRPSLTAEIAWIKEDRVVIRVKAMEVALWVWLEANQPGVFSDNFFPMYVPEMFLEFVPYQMTKECCKIHVTSLNDHYHQAGNNVA
jgi:beta-mannosidase